MTTIPINKKQAQDFFNWIEKCVEATEVPTSDPDGTWSSQEVIELGSPFSDLDQNIEQQCFPIDYPLRANFCTRRQMHRMGLNRRSVEWLQQLKWVAAYTDIDPTRLEKVTIRATAQRVQMLHLLKEQEIHGGDILTPNKYEASLLYLGNQLNKHPILAICMIAALAFQTPLSALRWIAPVIGVKLLAIYITYYVVMHGSVPDRALNINNPWAFSVIVPLAEEIQFRGVLQSTILKGVTHFLPKSRAKNISIFLSGSIFGAGHYHISPLSSVVNTIHGYFQGFLAHRYGLGASALTHIIWNGGIVLNERAANYFFETHEREKLVQKFKEMHRKGLEPLTTWSEAKCSIH